MAVQGSQRPVAPLVDCPPVGDEPLVLVLLLDCPLDDAEPLLDEPLALLVGVLVELVPVPLAVVALPTTVSGSVALTPHIEAVIT